MLRKDVTTEGFRIERLNAECEGLKERKANIADMEHLTGRMDQFSDIENIEYIQTRLLPKLQKFTDLIDYFHADNKDVKSCIREFDKSIGTKANKIEMHLFKEDMHNIFI